MQVVEVSYARGGWSESHRHPCAVVGYVLEGAVRMQLQGEPERIYSAGESFVETPNDVHEVSANASDTAPAFSPSSPAIAKVRGRCPHRQRRWPPAH